MKRAKALARLLSNVKVEVIYTTPFNRTQQTAQFVADHNKLPIQTYKMDQDFPTLTDTLAKKYPGKSILIVGHSNTLPMNIARLTKKEVYIAESEFDNIYMIQVHNQATTSHLLQLKYGD